MFRTIRAGSLFSMCGVALAVSMASGVSYAADDASGPKGFYFDQKMIAAVHAKGGGRLFEQPGVKYHVIAGEHDKPNMAEIHRKAADIVYFIEGHATVVTGGTIDNPTNKSPDEVVGPSITGGDERHVGPGDMVVMLAGTPHWFKEVTGTVKYLTIHLDHLD